MLVRGFTPQETELFRNLLERIIQKSRGGSGIMLKTFGRTHGHIPRGSVSACCAARQRRFFELLIPLVMSDIVDIGIANGDQDFILRKGIQMVIMAMVSLCFGLGGATCSSIAGMGFGANLRAAEYDHIQDYAFSNIEKFSTASLVTRLTNDVNNLQMTLMFAMRLLVRAPVMLVAALFCPSASATSSAMSFWWRCRCWSCQWR